MARKTTKKELTFRERLQAVLEAEAATYEKEGISRQFVITFPNRQKPPLVGRFAVWLLGKSGGIIQVRFDEIKK